MKQFNPRRTGSARPEAKIQKALVEFLTVKGWYVRETHGSAFSQGWPDLFICHKVYGHRWVEVKLPGMKGSHYTAAQLECFPIFCTNGSPVWVLTGATKEEYNKLFKPFNWYKYLPDSGFL